MLWYSWAHSEAEEKCGLYAKFSLSENTKENTWRPFLRTMRFSWATGAPAQKQVSVVESVQRNEGKGIKCTRNGMAGKKAGNGRLTPSNCMFPWVVGI